MKYDIIRLFFHMNLTLKKGKYSAKWFTYGIHIVYGEIRKIILNIFYWTTK